MRQRPGGLRAQGRHGLSTGLLAELLSHPAVTEEVTLGSALGVMAFHGGDLEEGTDRIADEVAARTGASRYVVRQGDGLRWHVPSTCFVPDESPALATFLDHVQEVVTIHGYGRRSMFTTVLLGGRNRALAAHVGAHLRAALPGYEVIDDLDDVPRALRGVHPANPVNRPSGGGVQIELPPRVRGNGPFWNGWDGGWPSPHTERLVDGLAAAVASWPVRAPAAP